MTVKPGWTGFLLVACRLPATGEVSEHCEGLPLKLIQWGGIVEGLYRVVRIDLRVGMVAVRGVLRNCKPIA